MKLLVLNWGAYTQYDIEQTLLEHHISFKTLRYCFRDKNQDEFFYRRFCRYIKDDSYDAVFTINYFPLVAQACHTMNIKYLSWSYDNPLNVRNIEETMPYETNFIFLFDRKQTEYYRRSGFSNIYHLPLAVNPRRLNGITLSENDYKQFASPVSFVGKLYISDYPDLVRPLEDYTRGYLDSVIESQFNLYGYYLIRELLTDELIAKMNHQYAQSPLADQFTITADKLSYAMATHVTRRERIILLSLLSRKFPLKLYSRDRLPMSSSIQFMGSVNYPDNMVKVFKASKINLNITLKILETGIPLRALDILGAGGFLLSNYQEELAEFFVPDQDLVIYESLEDAVDKAGFYLSHEDIRSKIAENGRQRAAQDFSYARQLGQLFKTAKLN